MDNVGLIREATGRAVLEPIPVLRLNDDYLLVKTVAVALNPTDWTTLDAVGADGELTMRLSSYVEEVQQRRRSPFNLQNCECLIWSGRKIITTCSAKHFSRMKGLGVDGVYDYVGIFSTQGVGVVRSCLSDQFGLSQRTPKVGEQIHADTEGRLKLVFDTVAVDLSAAICAEAMGPDGGVYCNLLGIDCPRPDVKSILFLGYSLSGESYIFEGETYAAQPEDLAFGVRFYGIAEKLWAEGKWKAHPQRLEGDGLLGTIAGTQQMREGKVSGEKLVYMVEETLFS